MAQNTLFITEEEITDILWQVVERFVKPDFIERGFNASGNWLQSVEVSTQTEDRLSYKGNILAPHYTEFLIRGRGANKNQNPEAIRNWVKWYAPHVFEPWMQNKGITDLDPWILAYSIARTGTRIFKDGGTDFLEILSSEEVISFIRNKISELIRIRVEKTLFEELKKLRKK